MHGLQLDPNHAFLEVRLGAAYYQGNGVPERDYCVDAPLSPDCNNQAVGGSTFLAIRVDVESRILDLAGIYFHQPGPGNLNYDGRNEG